MYVGKVGVAGEDCVYASDEVCGSCWCEEVASVAADLPEEIVECGCDCGHVECVYSV